MWQGKHSPVFAVHTPQKRLEQVAHGLATINCPAKTGMALCVCVSLGISEFQSMGIFKE